MRDKVILGVTLSVVLLLTLLIYAAVDFQRTPAAKATAREESIEAGKVTFAQYCVQCHGPKGEGCIGPAVNRDVWRAEINGVPTRISTRTRTISSIKWWSGGGRP